MTEFESSNGTNDQIRLDRFDRGILSALAQNGRLSITDLAHCIGLSKSPTQARLRRLEHSGVIKGYGALLDPIQLGLDHVAFVEVRLSDTREAALSAFNAAVTGIGAIEQVHMIAGNFDYLMKIRTQDMADYRRVLGEEISSLPHVASTSTYVAMQAVKEDVSGDLSGPQNGGGFVPLGFWSPILFRQSFIRRPRGFATPGPIPEARIGELSDRLEYCRFRFAFC